MQNARQLDGDLKSVRKWVSECVFEPSRAVIIDDLSPVPNNVFSTTQIIQYSNT